MPAYATQTAPKQTQNSQQQPKKQKPEAPKGLAALPQSAGIAALVVMVALALPSAISAHCKMRRRRRLSVRAM